MFKFKYEALDITGAEIKDVIEASNEQEAVDKIKSLQMFVTKLNKIPELEPEKTVIKSKIRSIDEPFVPSKE